MPTIQNSELTAEQWKELTGKILEEQRGMTLSDFSRLFETDITKDRGDYIHTEPRRVGKITAREAAEAARKISEKIKSPVEGPKEGDTRFGSDGVEFFLNGKWNPMIGKANIDSSKLTGRKADFTIFDDNINEEQIVSDNTDVLASIKKADQLSISGLDIADRTLDFAGGMVAMYIKNKGFRRKAAKPCKMTIWDFYDGKKKGVICKLVTDDHHSGGIPADLQHIEIPVSELASYFRESDVLKVLGEMTVYAEGTAPTRATNLYSEESISGLPDFGAF